MNWRINRLSNFGSRWPVFAVLLVGQLAWTQDFCDDFVGNLEPFDCDPVCYTRPWWGPWDCTPTEEGLDCFRTGDFTGHLIADRAFAGDIRVRARASSRERIGRPSVGITAHFDFESVSGYSARVRPNNGGFGLFRWDNERAAVETGGFVERWDPELPLDLELLVNDAGVEFRFWFVGMDRPETPILTLPNDRTYRTGKCSVSFGNLPIGLPCRIESFCVSELDAVRFLRGDCNDDGRVDISDAVCILNWLFLGGATPSCIAVTNTNGDAGEDISDAAYLLNHLFLGEPAPFMPFPECGPGTMPTDGATCETRPKNCP